MLRRFQDIFGKKPNDKDAKFKFFNDLVERVSNRTAQEAIFLKNGGFICFSTRTKSAALGFSFDIVVYDEAQELKTEHMQAIQPTTTSGAHHNTQLSFLVRQHVLAATLKYLVICTLSLGKPAR